MHKNIRNGDDGDDEDMTILRSDAVNGKGGIGAAAPASMKETSGREESKAEDKRVKFGPPKNEGGKDDGGKHRICGLMCKMYGGLSNNVAEDIIYRSNIPSDSVYASPFNK